MRFDEVCGARFGTAEEAWLWALGALAARANGERGTGAGASRPCEPDDVALAASRLVQRHVITDHHARVLCAYGKRGAAPDPRSAAECCDAQFWAGAMAPLKTMLQTKGIVA